MWVKPPGSLLVSNSASFSHQSFFVIVVQCGLVPREQDCNTQVLNATQARLSLGEAPAAIWNTLGDGALSHRASDALGGSCQAHPLAWN